MIVIKRLRICLIIICIALLFSKDLISTVPIYLSLVIGFLVLDQIQIAIEESNLNLTEDSR